MISAMLIPVLCTIVAFVAFADHGNQFPQWNPNNAWCQSFGETAPINNYCNPSCSYPYHTSESAWFEPRNATSIYWNRDQTRLFDQVCGGGFNYCYNTLRHTVLNANFPSGFWDGYETKAKISGEPKVNADSNTKIYRREQINGVEYRCPTHYQSITANWGCNIHDWLDWDPNTDISEDLATRPGFPLTERYTIPCINGTKPGQCTNPGAVLCQAF